MRTVLLVLGFLMPFGLAIAATNTVQLPKPKTESGTSVEKALHDRRSVRTIAATPLNLETIGQLCWAAQGVTDEKGHRTAPSARASYPLSLYVLVGAAEGLPAGLYRYEPAAHALLLQKAGDLRSTFSTAAKEPEWVTKAPAVFFLAGDRNKVSQMKERGTQFMYVEAGLAAQGFFLQAVALKLASTYVGGFNPEGTTEFLGLPAAVEVMAVLPVGYPQ